MRGVGNTNQSKTPAKLLSSCPFFLVNFSPLFLACSYKFKLVLTIAHLWCQECHLQKIVECRTLYCVLMKPKQTLQLYDSKPDLKNSAIEWIGPQLHKRSHVNYHIWKFIHMIVS